MKSHRAGPETDRLKLRALSESDAEAFFQLNSDPDVMRFTGEDPFRSLGEAREAIANYPDFDTIGYGRWGCELKEEGALIGFCGLKYLESLDVVDLGYRFLPQYWGRGLATEACLASIRFGFEVIGLTSIIAMVLPENLASIRVLEKVGMMAEGRVTYEGLNPLRFGIQRSPD